jgi:pyocin large subunit-like protein
LKISSYRHSPAIAVAKGNLSSSQVVAIDAPLSASSNNPQHHQFQPNAQFQQQMYHQQTSQQQTSSHVNSIPRARQTNSYQAQQSAVYAPQSSVHKTKN